MLTISVADYITQHGKINSNAQHGIIDEEITTFGHLRLRANKKRRHTSQTNDCRKRTATAVIPKDCFEVPKQDVNLALELGQCEGHTCSTRT